MNCKNYKTLPTQKLLKEQFAYNHFTGELWWAKQNVSNNRVLSKPAGSIRVDGATRYIDIGLYGKTYQVHRLIWMMAYGQDPADLKIDHIDGNGLNNRLDNLRLVTVKANCRNRGMLKNNTSGVMGVHRQTRQQRKWQATIMTNGKQISLGCYEDWFDAVCARKSAEVKYGYHANHGRAA